MHSEPVVIEPENNPSQHPLPILETAEPGVWRIQFEAMASPCEILIDDASLAKSNIAAMAKLAVTETWRIEQKYSRYKADNIVHQINHASGQSVKVDEETQRLLDYAKQCFELSDGLFDITSGPLRKVWQFKGEAIKAPERSAINSVLKVVGWQKASWQPPHFSLPEGGEIDFGGIVKEYAVDRVAYQLAGPKTPNRGVLVNFGGDICCSGNKAPGKFWQVGLEQHGHNQAAVFEMIRGGIATSGDTYRYLIVDGKKVSHLLNPLTGWPIESAPQTVTVAAQSCTLAGMLASFAMLQGADAEIFLKQQGVQFWIQRA